jgi:predicted Holliday junction resolvase-like endonuclease
MIEWLLIAVLLLITFYLFWKYAQLKGEIGQKSKNMFDEWKSSELETRSTEKAEHMFRQWKNEEEKIIRKDAISKSASVIKGKVTEHLVPYFPNFPYNPKDARFLGTPVDLIMFDGLSEESIENIIFIEVKTGNTANLSKRERAVRACIEKGKVSYKVIHIKPNNEDYANK